MRAPADLADRTFDLVVIGGGINGAAIARDAARRGLSVCLLDARDWGWGTSAKSSKLAHGGLRYLELFEFGLVHEALQDRERWLKQAPHLVRPLRFLYPIYPHVAARRAVRVGLWLYDLLSHGKSVPGRDYLNRARTLQLAPGLNAERLRGGATYFDGQIQSVERLVLEMVLDARAHGAVCLNHAAVKRIVVDESGGRHAAGVDVDVDGQRIRLRAGAVVNATGCWVDETLGELAAGQPPKVRKTKGAHVVVPRFVDVALIVKAASDGRTFFILPWGPHCVIGTTDTDYAGDAGDAVADEADVRYLLDEARHYFPQAPLDRVEYTYAGVRALVNEQGVTESNVTRRHILYDHGERDGVAGLWTLQGGKITTARTLGEECVDRVCAYLGRRDAAKDRPTRKAPLPGCPAEDWEPYRTKAIAQAAARGLDAGSAAHLVDAYGARWPHVLDHDPQGATRIHPAHPHLVAEIGWAVVHEDARTLGDVLLRRTDLGLAVDGAPVVARRVADRMAALLGWDAGEQARQWEAYVAEARHFAVPQAVDVPR